MAVAVLAILGITIFTRGVSGKPLGAAAATVFGVLYTGGMLSFGYAIRYHDYVIESVPVPLGRLAVTAGGFLPPRPLIRHMASPHRAVLSRDAFRETQSLADGRSGNTTKR